MKRLAYAILLTSTLTGFAWAQDEGDPSRGVARISIINGDVSVKRGDSGEVTAAALNAPLMSQDYIHTGENSRAEVQFNSTDVLRMSANTDVHLADIEYNRYQIQIAAGTITFTVYQNPRAQGEIDTPSVSVRPTQPGAYRITVRDDGTSEITVRAGAAEIFSPRGTETLKPGQTMLARGNASDPEFQMERAIPMDEWDNWNDQCDQRYLKAESSEQKYVGADVYGTDSMEGYGQWQEDPDYGNVWVPTVAPGWAPYRYGRWVWEDYYGWTWVSYDPWGWAPYHWGRWNYGRWGWSWCPGGIGVSPYWSPALVAFFGFGPYSGFNVGFGFGWGNIGWVALGPHEACHPWWGREYYGRGFGRGGIIVNNTNVYNTYRNARVMNGVTAVGAGDFGRRGFTGNSLRVTAGELRSAGLVRGQVPLTPGRESLRFSDRPANGAGFARAANTRFATHMQPAQVERVPFAQQQRGIQQTAQRTFTGPAAAGFRGGSVSGQAGAWRGAGATSNVNSGWRPANRPPAAESYQRPMSPSMTGQPRAATPAGGAWGRFGESRGNVGSYAPQTSGGPRAVRIAPQIVHERPAEPGSFGYGTRGGYSAPAPAYRGGESRTYSATAPAYHGGGYSAPAPAYRGGESRTYSAPATPAYRGGGGGGGGGHYSAPAARGGGGEGGHSGGGGGGGGHHR